MSIQEVNLKVIADAIREKEGNTGPIKASDFPDRILALKAGLDTNITINKGTTQEEWLAAIAQAIRAKEGSNGVIPASTFKQRILALEDKKPSRLPEGYTEVEYIKCSNNIHFDTGVKPSTILKVVMDVQYFSAPSGSSYSYFFGSYYKSGSTAYSWGTRVGSTTISGAVSTGNWWTVSKNSTPRRVIITADALNKVIKVDNESIGSSTSKVNASMPNIYLLDRSGTGTAGTGIRKRLYSSQIYSNNTLIHDYVPCFSSNEINGIYDLIEGTFLSPSGESTIGPAV